MTDVDTDLLRSFVAVAETLHFTKAGELVNRTQSAVSQQIKRLESELGVRLFERGHAHTNENGNAGNNKGVRLTEAGESFLPYVRKILKAHDEALATLRDPKLKGRIHVGVCDELAMCFFPEVLSRFAEHYPHIQVEVRCETGIILDTLLAQEELDLYVSTTLRTLPGTEIIARTPLLWVTSERHFAHETEPLPVAFFQKGCSYRDHATQALEDRGRTYRIAYSSPSLAGIHAAVASGLAVAPLITSAFPPDVRLLGEREGFPPLPLVNVFLARSKRRATGADCFYNILSDVICAGEAMQPARILVGEDQAA